MGAELKTVGRSELRKDAFAKASGAAQYAADIPLKGVNWGAVLRSPHHHARIVSLDAVAARRQAEVLAVVTAADIPGSKLYAALFADQPALAGDVVRHKGEPVALVVAKTKAAAQKAVKLIQVEYDVLPAVFDPVEALLPDAPKVHTGGNLLTHYDFTTGDPAAAFAAADIILEETFRVPRISPCYMEPETSLARWNADGSLTVWVSSQKPFVDRSNIAGVLGMQEEQVQVISAVIGGAFGGKEDSGIAVLAGLGAWAVKGSVRLVNNRSDSFLAHPKRHPAVIRYRMAAKQDGTLLAVEVLSHMDTGAYASYGPAVAGIFTELLPGSYRIPNVHVDTRLAYTNCPFSGAMRGFGSPQAHFALESMIDMLAHRLVLDPLEVRRKNMLRPGDCFYTGVAMDDSALSLERILEEVEQARRKYRGIPPAAGKCSGVGFALAVQSMGLGAHVQDDSTNRLEWLPDGSVAVYVGAPDLGEGLATVAEQMTAEELGIPYHQVVACSLNTSVGPNGGVTCASRMTYLVGNSLLLAAVQLKNNLLKQAADLLKQPVSSLRYESGSIYLTDGKKVPVAEVTSRLAEQGMRVEAEATATFTYPPEKTPNKYPVGIPHIMFVFGAQVVRVEVDMELGTVEVKDITAIHDVGKAINRAAVEGQIEGAVAQGLGYGLYEDMQLKRNGEWVDSFSEYLIPTAREMPHIECVILEQAEESGPYGAKGVGEMGLVPTAPAITNAIFDAVGVRLTRIPVTPEALLKLA